MRIAAAIFALILGTSVALAQDDSKGSYGPVGHVSKAKSTHKPRPKAARKHRPVKAKSAKTKPARTKAAKSKPAKSKPAAASKSVTTGSVAASAHAAPASLRNAFDAIPLAERIAIQSDLIWTGDYNGPVNGELGGGLVEAVKSYQKRHKSKLTGVLSPRERQALVDATHPRQREVGWRLLEDPVTGARVGVPVKLATGTTRTPTGTRWSSAQGQLQIETFRIDTGATLEAVFEQQKKPARRRTIRSSVLRPDYFVVTGMQGLKKFHVRTFASNGEIRGIKILYDQAMEGTMDPMVSAMSSAFSPFASEDGGGIADAQRRVEYGNGLIVSSSGHVVTARRTASGCKVIAIPGLGNAEHLAEQKNGELALLRIYGAHKLVPIGMPDAVPAGNNITLVGIADPQAQSGGSSVTAVPMQVNAAANSYTLASAPALGFSGAAALDGQGRFLGIAVFRPSVVAGPASAPQAAVVPLAKVRSFLNAHDVAPAPARPGVEHAKAAVVRVICVRK